MTAAAPQAAQRKAQAQVRLSSLKQGVAYASVAAFGVFSLLVGSHQIGGTATGSASALAGTTTGQSNQSQTQDSGYFDQGQGGYSVGSANSNQAPVAISGTS